MTRLLVNIDVPDVPAAVTFYCAAFDLRVGRRFDNGFVELLGAEAPIYLLLAPAGSQPTPSPSTTRDYERHWTPVHLDIVVDDLDAALARALAAGARLEKPTREAAYGRLAVLSDPFGHGFCLLQFTGRGYDELPSTGG